MMRIEKAVFLSLQTLLSSDYPFYKRGAERLNAAPSLSKALLYVSIGYRLIFSLTFQYK